MNDEQQNRKRGSSKNYRKQIYDVIREKLQKGSIAPGERLVERTLAESLGVSRTPVREALFQLGQEGLLVEAERGYMLPVWSVKQVHERLELQMILEPKLANMGCKDASDQQIENLLDAFEEEKRTADLATHYDFLQANIKFRSVFMDLCGNKLLSRTAKLYDDQFQSFRVWGLKDIENRKRIVSFHGQVCAAMKNRDAEAAESAVVEMFEWITSEMLARYKKQQDQPAKI